MNDPLQSTLTAWRDFYLLAGTAAAALTGLQFVVQSLLATNLRRAVGGGDPMEGIDAFGTPTVVHFTVALLLSAALCVPWPGLGALRGTVGVLAAGALVYSIVVLRRTRRQQSYVPVFEDWLWHVLMPAAANGAVLVAVAALRSDASGSLFVIAAATVLLICVGIHNAWDTVTYLTVHSLRNRPAEK